jgi:hypothetical protein
MVAHWVLFFLGVIILFFVEELYIMCIVDHELLIYLQIKFFEWMLQLLLKDFIHDRDI